MVPRNNTVHIAAEEEHRPITIIMERKPYHANVSDTHIACQVFDSYPDSRLHHSLVTACI